MIAIYARKSIEKENSISIDTQIEYCKSVIKPDERNEKVVQFVDNGYSGGNMNRDGFQKMMKQIMQGKITKVIVYKLDRISRSLVDFVNILQTFKDSGVEFISSQEAFDTSSPYGELIVKILMVFAEFERTSIINRITQAYAHRSEMGFYMGGRQPYGFELVPTVISGIKTKKLNPIPEEIEQIKYIFEVYSLDNISLRRLMNNLIAKGIKPTHGSEWSTSKLSTILKNPLYVKADADVYEYYDNHGTQMVSGVEEFTGERGAQLYGRTKHEADSAEWSDMKLVLMPHEGIINSEVWLKCQRKIEKNKQIGNSLSNKTSWLAGKIVCEKCGHTMTTIKGKINKEGEIRRYFNCTGRSHKKSCTGPKVSVYAEDLENAVYECIAEKLAGLKDERKSRSVYGGAEVNALKIKIKEIETAENKLMDMLVSGGLNEDLFHLANEKATRLKQEKLALAEKLEKVADQKGEIKEMINLAKRWNKADYCEKKEVAGIIIERIVMSEDGNLHIIWNI